VTFHELIDLLVRWFHVIAGIMWIGNSMLFNWLDRNLVKPKEKAERPGFQGEIWMVHSGGFYEIEKKLLPPGQLPKPLHWFKWQNGLTWISGIFLLMVVYYMQASAFMVDKLVYDLAPGTAVWIGIGTIVGAWLVYDVLWRTMGHIPTVPHLLTIVLLAGVTYLLGTTLAGRAAYIHVGVVIGTIMTGNVWTVILPSQRALVAATESGKEQDAKLGDRAKQRSIHNNYLTFPLIFIMISNHFPSTFGNQHSWLVLMVLMAAGAAVRYGMNLRYSSPGWWAMVGVALALGLFFLIRLTVKLSGPKDMSPAVSFATADGIIGNRCRTCHSVRPTDELSKTTGGVVFDTPEQIVSLRARIRARAVELRNMPLVNKTQMTDEEREILRRWIDQGADPAATGE
jgi:uncharacterized membrane protein